ncbi:MAG: DUF402 domain-containing protein [Chloroflexi bacterium]|nr:DUF402 domain-containing protein [Chloroflexota bacterium]
MTHRWQRGDQIVLREIWRGRVWSGRPYTIVEDSPRRLVMYMGAGVRWMRPVRGDGSAIHGREPHWSLGDAVWPIEALRIVTPGRHHSVLLLWTAGFGEFIRWYVNLEDPLTRSAIGFDYLDQLLDIEIAPDLWAWNWKDADELEDAVGNGLLTPRKADFIRAEGNRVLRSLDDRAPPFDEKWHLWRPDPQWDIPCLPDGWDDPAVNPARGGDTNS